MKDYALGAVEAKFADLIWANEPLASRELARLAEEALGWKRTTTYTVLRKLCDRGIFKNEGGAVSSLVSREQYYGSRGRRFVKEAFGGSLPMFLAAFAGGEALSADEIAALKKLIDESSGE